ncbi:L-threonylcarbamoyladenylate synthase [Halalkalicoccus jeotgali]|uniref:L-threonylcarbamoyladenylate synthase n=1 Tax=Halalkalicoccus jeotgali (strain DSM 18796 / CECT 7217 / JCM 14584 / KCTC 4019 / B3) TaxID=795797 RepID=D8J4B4_HALJB|nr:L-threonylcarbamoyladenylate synthase [Halalkalicoccus jeotgali]ADJ13476.1 Sua5/YciO/YrdC/YwlC family protein [Halalkalicoccus jeotgali B3]ELY33049.1 Sua5/YciO/YrdC/YwlC family protein [Halalkalicoccus jeotgali B3]
MELDRAVRAIRAGELVVYPTETVYGLGADALDPAAVERVYEAKGRARSKPLSMAVPDVEAAARHTSLTDHERAFMREFLPGPVTVVVAAGPEVPEALTAGRDRVGIRIPDQDLALSLLEEVAPITATSANASGQSSARRVADLDAGVRRAAACVLDGGETGGTESTVVDVERGRLHRRGALAEEIEAWLEAQ